MDIPADFPACNFMKFYSTNDRKLRVPLAEAVFRSLPADGGLYMPDRIPTIDPFVFRNITDYSFQELAFIVADALLGEDIPKADLKEIVEETLGFDAPVRFLTPNTAVLELFHGPSFAFKDFGARFMSRVMAYLSKDEKQQLDVLVATSGDTGGAVALGFLGVQGTRVTILYPKGKVSKIQEQQLTGNGENIRALEIDGTFDDCQAMVKRAFNDADLNGSLCLTSANSINIARLIPQTFYYVWAYAQLRSQGADRVVFTVPSGNFGNIGAGLLAYRMGLPAMQFVAATNANDTVPRYLNTGEYRPQTSRQTLSNAMDVGDPSNWIRILDLFNHNLDDLRAMLTSYTFDDEQTRMGILELYNQYGYVACPHTAIGYLAAERYRSEQPGDYASLFLSTAHPCKFPEAIPADIYKSVTFPKAASSLSSERKAVVSLPVDFEQFKSYLLNSAD